LVAYLSQHHLWADLSTGNSSLIYFLFLVVEADRKNNFFQQDINIVFIIETTTATSSKPMLKLKNASSMLILAIKTQEGKELTC
jgi:hypothetical protein